MDYREKLKAWESGMLSEEESKIIEQDINKFDALLSYFDEKTEPAVLQSEEKTVSLADILNKRINLSIARTVFLIFGFAFLFIFGPYGETIMEACGADDIAIYLGKGIYSIIHCLTVYRLLYRSFIKKEKAPAVLLLIWNIVPTIISFIVSAVIGDAFILFLPAFYGYYYLIQPLIGENAANIFSIAGMAAVVILSAVSLLLSKKKIRFKPIPGAAQKIGTAAFTVLFASSLLFSTSAQIRNGYFPNSRTGAKAILAAARADGKELLTKDYIGMTEEELRALFSDYRDCTQIYADDTVSFHRGKSATEYSFTVQDGIVTAFSYTSPYICKYLYIGTEEIEAILDGKCIGVDETEMAEDFFRFAFLPNYIAAYKDESGKTVKDYHFTVDIPASEYAFRYFKNITVTVVDGVITEVADEFKKQ